MTGTDRVYAAASLEERKGYALALSRAGDLVPKGFRDRNGDANPGKILLAAEYGNMLGLHPMAALTGINVIEGKPSPAPALMSALVRRAGHKLRVHTTGTVKAGTIAATVTLIRSDDPDHPFESTWDVDRAKRADLWGKAGSWSKYPEAMLKWRAMSEVCRDGAEDVLLGAHYVPEELGAEVNEAGEMLATASTGRQQQPVEETIDAEVIDEQPVEDLAEAWRGPIDDAETLDTLAAVWDGAKAAHALNLILDGRPVGDVIRAKKQRLQAAEQARQEQDAVVEPDQVPAADIDDEDVPF